MKKKMTGFILVFVCLSLLSNCGGIKINIGGGGAEDPLKEYVLQGKAREKILVIPIRGFISDAPKRHLFGERPSMTQEIVSRLKKAEKDDKIKALVVQIDSAGGSTTAGDMIYHEIMAFKERKKVKVVAMFMDIAASGGYYVALPADRILAHPTSIVGSIGVIVIIPKVAGLMDKLGLAVDVNKSGKEKDMGSPFRPSTPEEQRIFQDMTDKMAWRFLGLVAVHRKLNGTAMTSISAARIYLADEAMRLGLIDRIGYMDDAIAEAKELAGLSKEAKVVVYRRTKYPNDNLYNTFLSRYTESDALLADPQPPSLSGTVPSLSPGFYYLWLPGSIGK